MHVWSYLDSVYIVVLYIHISLAACQKKLWDIATVSDVMLPIKGRQGRQSREGDRGAVTSPPPNFTGGRDLAPTKIGDKISVQVAAIYQKRHSLVLNATFKLNRLSSH